MWCSRGCLGPPAISDAWLCHVSIVGGARRRGCAAGGVPVFCSGLLEAALAGVRAERTGELGGLEPPDELVETLVLAAHLPVDRVLKTLDHRFERVDARR